LILAGIAVFAPQGLWPLIRKTYDRYLGPEPPPPASPGEPAVADAVIETPLGGGLS
jgi:hypothetical protein